MKKLIALLLVLAMTMTFTACSGSAEYKLGMGVDLNTDSSKDGQAQVDATVAAVVLDKNGKIVSCRLDVAQSKMDITDGQVDTAATFQTKMELGDAYGMVAYGNAIAEWDAQAKAFEQYVVGKTAEEVKNIPTTTNEHGIVATDEALLASCTMQISEFINAIVKACGDNNSVTFKAGKDITLGLAAITTAEESTAADEENEGVVKMYSDFGAAVMENGKIVAAVTDSVQPQITMDVDGVITGSTFKGTKMELGSDYGMVAYGNAIAEWDAQAKAFAAYTVGKTAEEVRAIPTTQNEHGFVPADETLLASCTMQITGMMAVIAQAADYAR
ncbi:MAG TPA: hypothetical protein IAC17_06080 [Candidatus Faecousia faecipullorum]|nr:hypothetical protein [Candidatus Faecousia faecipullorum]